MRESRSRLALLNEKVKTEYDRFLDLKKRFESVESIDNYRNIMDELHIKNNDVKPTEKKEEKTNFRHYIIEKKYHLYVGKDSQTNDQLTTKFAKQNDYWFHARGVSGSHAVLRVDNLKEPVPKNILKKAASIAAYHSKAKTSKLAPVAYALRKFVTKRKGMEPGKVSLSREEVLLVPPLIPDGCEYIS